MNKLFCERLSSRDIAVMKYGADYEALMEAYRRRHNRNLPYRWRANVILRRARAARERIFRNCAKCRYCKDFRGYVNNKTHYDCSFNPFIPEDKAITCQYYEERRSHE